MMSTGKKFSQFMSPSPRLRALALISVIGLLISSCGSSPLTGKWILMSVEGSHLFSCLACSLEGDVVEFLSDGTLIDGECVLQYEILDSGRFKCSGFLGVQYVNEYRIEGDELTISDDSGRVWTLRRTSNSE